MFALGISYIYMESSAYVSKLSRGKCQSLVAIYIPVQEEVYGIGMHICLGKITSSSNWDLLYSK